MTHLREPEDEEFDIMSERSNSQINSNSDQDHVLFVDVGGTTNEIPFEPLDYLQSEQRMQEASEH
jgi:hypothetical protein